MRKQSPEKRWEPDGGALVAVLLTFMGVKREELKLSDDEIARYLKELARRKLIILCEGRYFITAAGETVSKAFDDLEFSYRHPAPTAVEQYASGLLAQARSVLKEAARAKTTRKRKPA
jgi:hypothetical protein